MAPHKERGRQARKEDLAAAASDYLAMTEWGGQSTQRVVYKFVAFWLPTAPSRRQEGGPRRRRGAGGPDAGDGTEVLTDPEPAVLRWLPPPHLAHRRKCVVVKASPREANLEGGPLPPG